MLQNEDFLNLRTAFSDLFAAVQGVFHRILDVHWFGRWLSQSIHSVCFGADTEGAQIDTDQLRQLALLVLSVKIKDHRDRDRLDDALQRVKVLVHDSVVAAFSCLCDSSTKPNPATRRPQHAYLGIIVPSPTEPKSWVVRADGYEEGLFSLSDREKQVLFALWNAQGRFLRTEDICASVWGDSSVSDLKAQCNNLFGHIHKIRGKLKAVALAIERSEERDGYALIKEVQ